MNTNQTKTQIKPRVYSYLRFSTPEQKLGDSARRQMDLAKAYASKHGYIFDEQLRDEGLSGWSGRNISKGKLGRFLERVNKGDVPVGSILFVEEVDHISREEMTDALETIVFGLIKQPRRSDRTQVRSLSLLAILSRARKEAASSFWIGSIVLES